MLWWDGPCLERKYASKWKTAQCLEFLQRDNIYDTFKYVINMDEEYRIVFCEICKEGFFGKRIYSCYKIDFNDIADGATIHITFIKGGLSMCQSNALIDEFFYQKLDAVPIG